MFYYTSMHDNYKETDMPLDIRITKKDNYAYVVELDGSIDSDSYLEFGDELRDIVGEKTKAMLIDMKKVAYVSSIGIKALLDIKKYLEKKNASFAMINLQPQVKKIFEVLKLLPMFDFFEDMAQADKYIDLIMKAEREKV